jgi:hypothetical protein
MVGCVPHASAVVVRPVDVEFSSVSTATGVVGVTPIAAGLPKPRVVAVAALSVKPNSMSLYPVLADAMISRASVADVTPVVLLAKL